VRVFLVFIFLLVSCAHTEVAAAPEQRPVTEQTEHSTVANAWEQSAVKQDSRTGLVVQPVPPARGTFDDLLKAASVSISSRAAEEARNAIERLFKEAPTAADVLSVERLVSQYRSAFPKLKSAVACVESCEKYKKYLACADKAAASVKEFFDEELAMRLAVVKSIQEKKTEKQMAALESLKENCKTFSCARGQMHVARAHVDLAKGTPGVLKMVIHEQNQLNALSAENRKMWARSTNWNRACAELELTTPGKCRALEKEMLNQLTFTDFTSQAAGDALTSEHVKMVNAHYAPVIQNCLTEQAKRMTPPDAQQFKMTWVVANNGLVTEAHLRKDLDDTLLAQCIRNQFANWRYPTFTGELQNVEQTFTVTAVERRIR
jgi:hypothetical protein